MAVVFQFCTALLTLLMMTAESKLSKRPVLRFTAALRLTFLLKLIQKTGTVKQCKSETD